MMSAMPAASPAEGRSPSCTHAAATPITGVASVAMPAAPAEWRRSQRSDLYQMISFVTASGSRDGALLGFSKEGLEDLPIATPGDCCIRYFAWDARESTTPDEAAARISNCARSWLSSVCAT